jgi:hypothetical protein
MGETSKRASKAGSKIFVVIIRWTQVEAFSFQQALIANLVSVNLRQK